MKPTVIPDTTDPSDFGNASSSLFKLDSSLRCPICKDFFNGPVLLSECGHSFCSLCIRDVFGTKRECPTCRKAATEIQLKKNIALSDAVSLWLATRESLVQQSRAPPPILGTKRKRSSSSAQENGSSSSKYFREISSSSEIIDIDDDSPISSSKDVECPSCSKMVSLDIINRHLDSGCEFMGKDTNNKKQWAGVFAAKGKGKEKGSPIEETPKGEGEDGRPERLPIRPYDMMKDKEIRSILKADGLPTTGDSSIMKQRHKRWVMLFNANLDLSVMEPLSKLRNDLKQWEKDVAQASEQSTKDAIRNPAAYMTKHSTDFKKLVQDVKARSKAKQNVQSDSEVRSSSTPDSRLESGDI